MIALLLLIPLFILDLIFALKLFEPQTISELNLPLSALVLGPSYVLATLIARKYLDRRTFRSLGFLFSRHSLTDFLIGLTLPAAIMGSIFLIEWGTGWLRIEAFAWEVQTIQKVGSSLLLLLVAFLAIGFYEELLFRGYYMQNLLESVGRPWALFLTAVFFGLGHLLNPNASALGALGIFAAGYFLAFGWLRTNALWLPIGLHIGWNFFEGPIFGFPVSGIQSFSLIQVNVQGPQIVTGGAFGPEGGLILFPVLAVAAGVIWLYTRDRNEEVETS
jgi:hypothetical protein